MPPKEVMQLDDDNLLRSNNTPWIYYGGSYAGARAAHMRVKYPELVWGAIASSGKSIIHRAACTVVHMMYGPSPD